MKWSNKNRSWKIIFRNKKFGDTFYFSYDRLATIQILRAGCHQGGTESSCKMSPYVYLSLFVYSGPEKPRWGVTCYVYIYIYIPIQ